MSLFSNVRFTWDGEELKEVCCIVVKPVVDENVVKKRIESFIPESKLNNIKNIEVDDSKAESCTITYHIDGKVFKLEYEKVNRSCDSIDRPRKKQKIDDSTN
jgi:hypothetical protein